MKKKLLIIAAIILVTLITFNVYYEITGGSSPEISQETAEFLRKLQNNYCNL